jgi:methylmalonyl-CoA/ethylmalonyl-CoA epimerase
MTVSTDLPQQAGAHSADQSATASTAAPKKKFLAIDHIAIAVRELESAVEFFSNVMGFELNCRRTIHGKNTGMLSAEMEHNGIKLVLCQGTEPQSQVSLLIEQFGPGVAHIALRVSDLDEVSQDLTDKGMGFDTSIIGGGGLRQLFSSRSDNTGMSFEFIERTGEAGFREENVNDLFSQLEQSGAF